MVAAMLRHVWPTVARRGIAFELPSHAAHFRIQKWPPGQADKRGVRCLILGAGVILAGSLSHRLQLWSYHDTQRRPMWLIGRLPNLAVHGCKAAHCLGPSWHQPAELQKDGLSHEVRTSLKFPQPAAEVLEVVKDVGNWTNFMPYCAQSELVKELGNGSQHFRVRFGLSLGSFFVGDTVIYEVSQPERGLLVLRSINNEALTYVDRIAYTLSLRDTPAGSEVNVHLRFHARKYIYLRTWKRIERPLIEMIAQCLETRAASLNTDKGESMVVPEVLNSSLM
mmetsp:Transcript_6397/g.10853  ORF Transcript_6397/g.10853 Transcript_6397/m.10853 type:complete len:280 (+) Transcript_6397:76-915(+)